MATATINISDIELMCGICHNDTKLSNMKGRYDSRYDDVILLCAECAQAWDEEHEHDDEKYYQKAMRDFINRIAYGK